MKHIFIILFIALTLISLLGDDFKKITTEQVTKSKEGDKLYNTMPTIKGWADDMNYYEFSNDRLLLVNAKTGKSSLLIDYKKNKQLADNEFDPSAAEDNTNDFNKFLFEKEGAIFLYVRQGDKLLPLVKKNEPGGEFKNLTFSPDGSKIAYTCSGNLFALDIASKKTTQLTRDGGENILNGYASWVYYEEILGRGSNYRAFWWSPDNSKIAFMRFDQANVPEFGLFDEKGDYGKIEKARYPKAGFPNPLVKIGIADVKTSHVQWIDVNDPNEHYLAFPVWNKNSDKLYFQWMNRGQDHLSILLYDLKSNDLRKVYEERQPTWVDFLDTGNFYLLSGGDFLILSSKDGWYHIYYVSRDGNQRQVTSGNWSVTAIDYVDENGGDIYFRARKEDSTETDFYKTGYSGKNITKLTGFKGTHSVTVSPSCRYFLDEYSSLDTPKRLELRDANGKPVRKIADSFSPELPKYRMAKAELFHIHTDDGYALPAVWYLPPGFDKNKKYPVVMTVYGGPDSAVVANSYGGGYRGGLEKFFLAQEGIINLFVDNRVSSHFGKKGISLAHRQLGKWEINDFIQVVKYLRTLPYIDETKIGIKGHSYGGYVAAYALTYGAEYFKYGISGSPVIDWKLYDSVYTERFMDTPKENPEGYKNSSVLTYIDKFKGLLRITHGALDDNVHPQHTLQFIDKVLDTGKTVELMIYPGSAHGIRDSKEIEYKKSNINFWLKHFLGKTID